MLGPQQALTFTPGGSMSNEANTQMPPLLLEPGSPLHPSSTYEPGSAHAPSPESSSSSLQRHPQHRTRQPEFRLLLPGESPAPRCTTGGVSRRTNPECPGRPTPAGQGSQWRSRVSGRSPPRPDLSSNPDLSGNCWGAGGGAREDRNPSTSTPVSSPAHLCQARQSARRERH